MKFREVKLTPTINVVARLGSRFLFLEHPPASKKNHPRVLIPEADLRGKTPDRAAAQWCLRSVTGITLRLDSFSRVTGLPIESKDKLHHVFIVDLEQGDAERINMEQPGVQAHFHEVKQMRRYATERKIRTGNSIHLVSTACDLQTSRARSILSTGATDGADFVPVEA